MDILKLMIVFGVLVVMLWLKRPLYQGILYPFWNSARRSL